MLNKLIAFIKSRVLWKHILIYVLLLGFSMWGLLLWLGSYTKHGEYIKVPDFKGMKIDDLAEFATQNNVTYLVVDSIYDATLTPGVVIRQDPEYNADVKANREVYLYISSLRTPELPMPNLIDRSLRQAISMIDSYGLRLGTIEFVEDECTNCVLEQKTFGKEVKPGKIISRGSIIDLSAGKGKRDIKMELPCLYGLSKNEAVIKLAESSLGIGQVYYEECDEYNGLIYKQGPSCDTLENIPIGAAIDIFLTIHKNKIPVVNVDPVTTRTPRDAINFDN